MKRVEDSYTVQVRGLRYQYLNGQRRLFGGSLMQWIDEVAGIVATRHSGSNCITAVVDSLVFKEPAYVGDLIVLKGEMTYTGRTSMEVKVDTFRENQQGETVLINRAYLVMVAIDDNGKPREVESLVPETDEQKREWAMGEKRYKLRTERRKEDY